MVKAGGLIGELVETGLFILASNPWESGRLKAIAEREGFNIKKRIVIRRAPPWAKAKLHLKGMSPAQLQVIRNFVQAILEGKRAGAIGPGSPAPGYVKRALTGRRVVESPKRRMPKTERELEALVAKINSLIAAAPAVTPTPREIRAL